MNNISNYNTEFGNFWILNNDQWIGKTIKNGTAWDADKIKYIINNFVDKNKIALDIGANIGTHSIPYSLHFKHVHSFEPQSNIFDLLNKNIISNNINNITSYKLAIGHIDSFVTFSNTVSDGISKGNLINYNTNKEVNYGGIELGIGGESVQMKTIDSFNFNDVGFIKIDIEGCEKLAIWGAKNTIEYYRPVVLFENKKKISNEMKTIMNINDDILQFDIIYYFKNILKYSNIQKIKNDILLIP
jgi:FkbM family methyltransferase